MAFVVINLGGFSFQLLNLSLLLLDLEAIICLILLTSSAIVFDLFCEQPLNVVKSLNFSAQK